MTKVKASMGTCKTLLAGYRLSSQYQLLVKLMRFEKYEQPVYFSEDSKLCNQFIYYASTN